MSPALNGVETPASSGRPQSPMSNQSLLNELDHEALDLLTEPVPEVPSPLPISANKQQGPQQVTPAIQETSTSSNKAVDTQYPAENDEYSIEPNEPPPLQLLNGLPEGLDPIGGDEDLDGDSFNLVRPEQRHGYDRAKHDLEERSDLLFSGRHLQAIFDDSAQLQHFSSFLYRHRRGSVPLLTYYLDALKALRAMAYSNSMLQKLRPLSNYDFSYGTQPQPSTNQGLEAKAKTAFEELAREDLPMYITHVWIQTVTVAIRHKIIGTLRHSSEGLAEVFCLTDPSRHDNPIVFMSDEFNRTTQYGVDYVIGRNCRFLQGPNTNPFSVKRIRQKLDAGVEHYETFLNYRRDGSPFMNLVMLAPLYDSRGVVRYFIGAQVDVSGLAKSCYDLGALKQLVDEDEGRGEKKPVEDEITQLAEILDPRELDVVRHHGGDMHGPPLKTKMGTKQSNAVQEGGLEVGKTSSRAPNKRAPQHRVVLRESGSRSPVDRFQQEETGASAPSTTAASLSATHNGRLAGIYENFLLVRPYPSLRILFTSPSMAMPGILQTPLLERIGGSSRMHDQLVDALKQGQGVTARVKWLRKKMSHQRGPSNEKTSTASTEEQDPEKDADGRMRWLHCTPLVGSNNAIGVWMVVIVDEDGTSPKTNHAQSNLNPVITHERRRGRAATAESEVPHVNGVDADNAKEVNGTPVPDAHRPRLRTRRSSNTLGSPPPSTVMLIEEPAEEHVAPLSPSQHNLTSSRPNSPLRNLSNPGRFFNMNALSRNSTVSSFSVSKAAPSLLGAWRKQREANKAKAFNGAEMKKAYKNSSFIPRGDYRLANGA